MRILRTLFVAFGEDGTTGWIPLERRLKLLSLIVCSVLQKTDDRGRTPEFPNFSILTCCMRSARGEISV